MTTLACIMHKHRTDKLSAHAYDKEYERHFERLRNEPLKILEIGIGGWNLPNFGGAGLKTWADYFPNAIVVGMDIEDKRFLMTDRIWVWKGSQNDVKSLITMNDKMGPFDIVIDDGSHIQSDISISFETLFPLLNPGGVYVIEDIGTAYWKVIVERILGVLPYNGHPRPLKWLWPPKRKNTIRMICKLIDGLQHRSWSYRKPSEIQKMVQSIHVSENLVFFYKQP